jgi:hypothetical protein
MHHLLVALLSTGMVGAVTATIRVLTMFLLVMTIAVMTVVMIVMVAIMVAVVTVTLIVETAAIALAALIATTSGGTWGILYLWSHLVAFPKWSQTNGLYK